MPECLPKEWVLGWVWQPEALVLCRRLWSTPFHTVGASSTSAETCPKLPQGPCRQCRVLMGKNLGFLFHEQSLPIAALPPSPNSGSGSCQWVLEVTESFLHFPTAEHGVGSAGSVAAAPFPAWSSQTRSLGRAAPRYRALYGPGGSPAVQCTSWT